TASKAALPRLGVQHPRPAWRPPLSSSKPRISTQQSHAQAPNTPRPAWSSNSDRTVHQQTQRLGATAQCLGVGSSRQQQKLLSHTP
ncbi:hypothetical protein PIB30_115302, partial [Stylosanthes scabra]|nr:hypothetical protein [Stylosanthes scabra]